MKRIALIMITGAMLGVTGSCNRGHSTPCEARPTSTDTTIPSRAPHLSTPQPVACGAPTLLGEVVFN